MPKRLIPILSDEQVQQLADLPDHSPKPYLRERAGAILKLAHGLSASARALLSAAFLLALVLGHTSSALAQGKFVYVNNNIFGGPNTVSAFSVGADCSLTPVPGSPFPNTGGAFPLFAVTNASGTCLFALNNIQGATAFSIAADGSLTRVGAATGGSSNTGSGIAAYPAASCAPDLTVPQQITQVITQVQGLVTNGVLSSGQGAGLITKLNGVIAKLNSGQVRAACNQLNAFINQVNAFVNSGALSPEQGQALITAANNIRAQIGC